MAENNRKFIDQIINFAVRDGLGQFALNEMKQSRKDSYLREIENTINRNKPLSRKVRVLDEVTALREADAQAWFNVLLSNWDDIFSKQFRGSERSYIFELKDARNDLAHTDKQFSDGETFRIADTATRLLEAVDAAKQAEVTRKIVQELLQSSIKRVPVAPITQDVLHKKVATMSKFGIKPLWAGWQDAETVICFSPSGFNKWQHQIRPGTRMLLYETMTQRPGSKFVGVKGIIGEVEVVDGFAESEGLPCPTDEHEHPLRVKVLHGRKSVAPISLDMVRAILKKPDKFSFWQIAWYPLEESVYNEFLKIWDKS